MPPLMRTKSYHTLVSEDDYDLPALEGSKIRHSWDLTLTRASTPAPAHIPDEPQDPFKQTPRTRKASFSTPSRPTTVILGSRAKPLQESSDMSDRTLTRMELEEKEREQQKKASRAMRLKKWSEDVRVSFLSHSLFVGLLPSAIIIGTFSSLFPPFLSLPPAVLSVQLLHNVLNTC